MRSTFSMALSVVALAAAFIPNVSNAYNSKDLDYPPKETEETKKDPCFEIRDAIAKLPEEGGTIRLQAKVYNCTNPIVIGRSNVTLVGVKETAKARRAREADKREKIALGKTNEVTPQPPTTIIRLADYVHAPLLVIGDPKTVPTGKMHGSEMLLGTRWVTRNVTIRDIEFDGNLDNHHSSKECGEGNCDGDITSIRNNAVSIRGAEDIYLINVATHDSISGGVVTEKQCKRLKFVDLETYRNYFDGFAGYETVDSYFVGFEAHENRGAGISLDIRFNNNKFYGGELVRNGDVGIFARDVIGNKFYGMRIENSHSYGAFLASPHKNDAKGCATRNEFAGVQFIGSGKAAIRLNDNCTDNIFTELPPQLRMYAYQGPGETASFLSKKNRARTSWMTTMTGNVGCLSDNGQTPRNSFICDQDKEQDLKY